jgi:hypothetical protein
MSGERIEDTDGTLEDDVPVYESLYPELDAQCSHPPCSNETPGPHRICEDCTPVMLDGAPDECNFCGASLGPTDDGGDDAE